MIGDCQPRNFLADRVLIIGQPEKNGHTCLDSLCVIETGQQKQTDNSLAGMCPPRKTEPGVCLVRQAIQTNNLKAMPLSFSLSLQNVRNMLQAMKIAWNITLHSQMRRGARPLCLRFKPLDSIPLFVDLMVTHPLAGPYLTACITRVLSVVEGTMLEPFIH